MWLIGQPAAERIPDLFRPGRDITGSSGSEHLDLRPVNRLSDSRVGEVEAEHTKHNVEQGANNVGRLAASPDGGKCHKTNEIVDTRPEMFDLIGGMSHLGRHRPVAPRRSLKSRKNSSGGTKNGFS